MNAKEIGAELRKAREKKGLSFESIKDHSKGLYEVDMHDAEVGDEVINLGDLIRYADALGLQITVGPK